MLSSSLYYSSCSFPIYILPTSPYCFVSFSSPPSSLWWPPPELLRHPHQSAPCLAFLLLQVHRLITHFSNCHHAPYTASPLQKVKASQTQCVPCLFIYVFWPVDGGFVCVCLCACMPSYTQDCIQGRFENYVPLLILEFWFFITFSAMFRSSRD